MLISLAASSGRDESALRSDSSKSGGLAFAENNLKQMMARDRDDPLWRTALIPETTPEALVAANARPPDFEESLRRALSSRPELAASDINIEMSRINQMFYRDQTKPKIDAVATFSAAGLAGRVQEINFGELGDLFPTEVPAHLVGGNWDSLSNIWAGRYPTFRIGVSISLPLRNREAAANSAAARADGRRLEAIKNQREMFVEADVRNALERWHSARVRYDSAVIAREAAEEQYASEQRQFQAGVSTMFLVFERQSRFIAARSGEVRARADLAAAIADMDRAVARTLETHNIRIVE
jgi:HAE1 family hydrophobic/amphiphilic exporter-1